MSDPADVLTEIREIRSEIRSGRLADDIDAAIAESACALVVDLKSGMILKATPKACVMFGYLNRELNNTPLRNLIPERLRERHDSHFARFVAQPIPRQMGSRDDVLYGLKKGGQEFPVEIDLDPQILGDSRDICCVANIFDMSVRAKG